MPASYTATNKAPETFPCQRMGAKSGEGAACAGPVARLGRGTLGAGAQSQAWATASATAASVASVSQAVPSGVRIWIAGA